jgi:hypothetical protein
MSLFLITFLSLYGGLQTYIFFRLRSTFLPGPITTRFIAVLMALMTVAPLLVRVAEGLGHTMTASVIAWPGYVWMGSSFILGAALLSADSILVSAWTLKRCCGTAVPRFLTAAITCKVAVMVALPASGYALYEARVIRTEHVYITTDKLPPGSARVRVVQISDVHAGLLSTTSRLESILKAIREAAPDILVSTAGFRART